VCFGLLPGYRSRRVGPRLDSNVTSVPKNSPSRSLTIYFSGDLRVLTNGFATHAAFLLFWIIRPWSDCGYRIVTVTSARTDDSGPGEGTRIHRTWRMSFSLEEITSTIASTLSTRKKDKSARCDNKNVSYWALRERARQSAVEIAIDRDRSRPLLIISDERIVVPALGISRFSVTASSARARAWSLEAIPTLKAAQKDDPEDERELRTMHPSVTLVYLSRGRRWGLHETIPLRGILLLGRAIMLLPVLRQNGGGKRRRGGGGGGRGGGGGEEERKKGRERERERERERKRKRRLEEERAWVRKSPRGQERRKCPLRPLSSFEVHERLRRTKRRRSGYSLPFLLSRGVLPFPVEARTGRESLHGSLGHLPLPLSLTSTVKRRGELLEKEWEREREREREKERERAVGNRRVLSLSIGPPSSGPASGGGVVECGETPRF